MVRERKTFADMTRDSIRYLSNNTDVTYFADGSTARALVEATNLEISRLQDFIASVVDNSFLSSAQGIYLDLFGDMLGVPRIRDRRALVNSEDGAVRMFVTTGTLASRLPDPDNGNQGLVPQGTLITNAEQTIEFVVTADTPFPLNAKSVYIPLAARDVGAQFNVGANQLVRHNLSANDVRVTNDLTINTGADVESDDEYRFRLVRAMTTRFSSNETSIRVAALSQPGVSSVQLVPYARGAGTFDVLAIPTGNRLTRDTLQQLNRNVELVTAYGINPRIVEPDYLRFKISVQLRFTEDTPAARYESIRLGAQQAVLNYFGNIPTGGELVVNQIRNEILNSDTGIKDLRIIEMCVNGAARTLRNFRLREGELFIPDETAPNPVEII